MTDELNLLKPDEILRELYYNSDGTTIPIKISAPPAHVDAEQLLEDFVEQMALPDPTSQPLENTTPMLEEWLNGKPIVRNGEVIHARPIKSALKQKSEYSAHEIARRIRSGFWNGMMTLCERQKKGLDEVMADWLEHDPHGTFKMVSPFFPKQIEATVKSDLVSFLKDIERKRKGGNVIEGAVLEDDNANE